MTEEVLFQSHKLYNRFHHLSKNIVVLVDSENQKRNGTEISLIKRKPIQGCFFNIWTLSSNKMRAYLNK